MCGHRRGPVVLVPGSVAAIVAAIPRVKAFMPRRDGQIKFRPLTFQLLEPLSTQQTAI
jgi:hypothetical protein